MIIRKINKNDKKRVEEIAAKIWEGDDYSASVFDEWLEDKNGVFIGAEVDESLIGYGKISFLDEKNIWLEGLRKDPDSKIKGVATEFLNFFVKNYKADNLESIRFATYFGNVESIAVSERYGFKRILTMSLLNKEKKFIEKKKYSNNSDLTFEEFREFIINSEFYKNSKGFFTNGWIVYKLTDGFIKKLFSEHKFMFVKNGDEISSMIIEGHTDEIDSNWLGFIESSNRNELRYLIECFVGEMERNYLELVLPNCNAKNILKEMDFKSWEQENDFLLYELPIEENKTQSE
jgi:hypothetical protein